MTSCVDKNSEDSKLIQLLANVEWWNGTVVPEKVGTVNLKNSVTLEPLREHLVWAKLSNLNNLSAGSAIIAEPCRARSRPRNILIGRTVARLWADGWVPVKVINPSPVAITLRRNAKLADIYPCLALEDFDLDANDASIGFPYTIKQHTNNVELPDNSSADSLSDILAKYECIFSRHKLDCGKAEGYVHRIRLSDEHPFRLPYR